MRKAVGWATVALVALAWGCVGQQATTQPSPPRTSYNWQLPTGFSRPALPSDNLMSAAKVELGRQLFYDTRLSGNGTFSCASCHRQELAFTDGRRRAMGSTGELHPRSSMSLTNVAYNTTYNWADPRITRLEEQALNPMFNQEPVELGLEGGGEQMLGRLRQDERLVALFEEAFAGEEPSVRTITYALASFLRTLISGNSPYDRFVFWGEPLNESAARGVKLFFSERTGCSECHAGLNLSGPVNTARSKAEAEFHNTGLFDLDGEGAYPAPNRGVFEVTGEPEDMGRFRAPTLRNIAVTAPYMHDGSVATLSEVVRFYAAGGRDQGRTSAQKSNLLDGFELTAQEEEDLISFLEALTDREFLEDPRFGPEPPRSESEADAG